MGFQYDLMKILTIAGLLGERSKCNIGVKRTSWFDWVNTNFTDYGNRYV